MKIAIIPDVHGRVFWKKILDVANNYDLIIFLGDYLDAYESDNQRREEANFKEIIEFANNNEDKVKLLLGNHDCTYFLSLTPGSRHNYNKENEYKKLFTDNKKLFSLYYIVDNYLFSHAGVYTDWMNAYKLNFTDLNDFESIKVRKALDACDFYRGGNADVGSCLWADVRCSEEHKFYNDYYNVFGHTQLKYHIKTKKFACLDCREVFSLDTITNKIEKI